MYMYCRPLTVTMDISLFEMMLSHTAIWEDSNIFKYWNIWEWIFVFDFYIPEDNSAIFNDQSLENIRVPKQLVWCHFGIRFTINISHILWMPSKIPWALINFKIMWSRACQACSHPHRFRWKFLWSGLSIKTAFVAITTLYINTVETSRTL